MRIAILAKYNQNSHSPKLKMAADLAASHLADFIGFLAPQVGLEPTTLRLTAVEFADPPAAIGCYKLLSFVHFADSPLPANRYPYIPDYALF